jgi:hypothetical protein
LLPENLLRGWLLMQHQNSAGSAALLQTRIQEREDLLQRIQASLEADERVVAAWLFGSLGRGEEDALSDLDLWVLLDDQATSAVMAARHACVACGSEPLAVVEAPQNAPRGGAYLMALYPGETGPQQVDWYWQPASLVEASDEIRLLFNRRHATPQVGTPIQEAPASPDAVPEAGEELRNQIALFWAMLLIQAKYVARTPREPGLGFLGMLHDLLRDAGDVDLPVASPHQLLAEQGDPTARLATLRELAGRMEALMSRLSTAETPVSHRLIPQAHRYLDLVAAVIET